MRLTDILEAIGAVSPAQVATAVRAHQRSAVPVGRCLVEQRACTEETIVYGLSMQLGLPSVRLHEFVVPPAVLALVPGEIAAWHNALPVGMEAVGDGTYRLQVALSQPRNSEVLRHLREVSGFEIQPLVAGDREIAGAIRHYYGHSHAEAEGLHTAAMPDYFDPDDMG